MSDEAGGQDQRVAEVLERLRAGVAQRRGEVASAGAGREELRLRLVELQRLEYVQEPVCTSPRPVVGRLLVFARKAFFHLFHKWYARPLLHQQNEFNRAASQLAQELAATQQDLAVAVDRLAARLDALGAGREESKQRTVSETQESHVFPGEGTGE